MSRSIDGGGSTTASTGSYGNYSEQSTPFGISILVGLGILSLVGGLLMLFRAYGGPGYGAVLLLIAIALIIFKLWLLYGLHSLESWAWKGFMVIESLLLVVSVVTHDFATAILTAINLIYLISKRSLFLGPT